MANPSPSLSDLTPAEREVYRMIAQGKPNKIIAFERGVREDYVKRQVSQINNKLGTTNRVQVALAWHGLWPLAAE